MIADVSSTLTSLLTRQPHGPRSRWSRPFHSTAHRNTYSGIEIGFTETSSGKQVKLLGIKEVLSAPRSPWQRAYVERVIGSIRRECLDHVIIFDEASLRRTLRSYLRYYHRSRLHLSLDKDLRKAG